MIIIKNNYDNDNHNHKNNYDDENDDGAIIRVRPPAAMAAWDVLPLWNKNMNLNIIWERVCRSMTVCLFVCVCVCVCICVCVSVCAKGVLNGDLLGGN